MKPYYFIFLLPILAGCDYLQNHFEVTGTATNIKNGVFVINGPDGKTVFGSNIKDGKFSIRQQALKAEGYYTMVISDDDHRVLPPAQEEIYLSPGKYTIRIEPSKYPLITCKTPVQNELSAYHQIADSINALNGSPLQVRATTGQLKSPVLADVDILTLFNKKYPQNSVTAHLMLGMPVNEDPLAYFKVYQNLSAEAKNTAEGKQIGEELTHLVKLVPGAVAPTIMGTTPDGKAFDLKAMGKKVIIVDFWRSGDRIARNNHQNILNKLSDKVKKEVGMVSVSFDTRKEWWLTSIKEDRMDWPQVSDLKGDDSPNAANWAIKMLPTYYVLSGKGEVIQNDVPYQQLDLIVNEYVRLHP